MLRVSPKEIWQGVAKENHEVSDYCVRPLEGRLGRIFRLTEDASSSALLEAMCRRFVEPIFKRARPSALLFRRLQDSHRLQHRVGQPGPSVAKRDSAARPGQTGGHGRVLQAHRVAQAGAYALHFGYAGDPRTHAIIRYLAHDAQAGGGCHEYHLTCSQIQSCRHRPITASTINPTAIPRYTTGIPIARPPAVAPA